ncbi:MAG: sigma-70 family RNA polymerase sigma factor [Pirellulales bacterium]|nr:sigma-70 family RNA polymerase sigma factor [Pirellulales bacterium]
MATPLRGEEFAREFTTHGRFVWSYIRTLVPHKADAEDLFQDVNTTLWQKFEEFETGTNFRAWATQIARYKIMQFHERNARRRHFAVGDLQDLLDAQIAASAESLDTLHWALDKCVQQLDAEDQELIRQRYAEDATVANMAAHQQRSQRAVYRSLARVHSWLLECIRRHLSEEAGA